MMLEGYSHLWELYFEIKKKLKHNKDGEEFKIYDIWRIFEGFGGDLAWERESDTISELEQDFGSKGWNEVHWGHRATDLGSKSGRTLSKRWVTMEGAALGNSMHQADARWWGKDLSIGWRFN